MVIREEYVEHLIVQLSDAARETGWESLMRDAEMLQQLLDEQRCKNV